MSGQHEPGSSRIRLVVGLPPFRTLGTNQRSRRKAGALCRMCPIGRSCATPRGMVCLSAWPHATGYQPSLGLKAAPAIQPECPVSGFAMGWRVAASYRFGRRATGKPAFAGAVADGREKRRLLPAIARLP